MTGLTNFPSVYDGELIVGTQIESTPFKLTLNTHSKYSKRRGDIVLQVNKTRPVIARTVAMFQLYGQSINLDVQDFTYREPTGLLVISNHTSVTGAFVPE